MKPYLIVFVASACGLVLEIVAGRLLAPSIGVSLYTWTAIIGVVLAGISVGSFVGGMVADRFPSPTTLGVVLVAGGISSLSVLPLADIASESLSSLPVLARIVFMTGGLFFVPSLILGMVTPLVIKFQLRDLADTGKVVGRIYALSAAGSIFGTFITGFVLIQLIGTRHTLILVAVTLVILALAFGNLRQTKILSFGSLVILLGLGAAGFTSGAFDSQCVRESNYFCIDVRDVTLDADREVKALYLDQLLHSYVALDDPTYLAYGYEKIFGEIATYVAQQNPSVRVLFIGGGGYTMPRNLEELYPESSLEVIEIDPEVTRVAFDYLGLRPDTRIVTYNQDARLAVPSLPEGQYDLVIGDAFNDVSVPYHLTTKEFNEQVRALLKDDGIYAVNVIDKLHSGRFLRAYVNTLQQTFDYVYIMRDVPDWESDRQLTYVVVGSHQSLSSTALHNAGVQSGLGPSVSHIMPQAAFDSWFTARDNILLTDDYAPVDNLLAPIFLASTGLSSAGEHYNTGVELQSRGRLDEAIAEYDEAIRLDTGAARAYHNRGHALTELGQFQRAILDYDEAIRLNPQYVQAYNNRGSSYSNLGEHQQAIRDFDEAIRLDPDFALAYLNRGIAYGELGQHLPAIQDFGEAIRLELASALAYRNRGTTYLTLGQFRRAIQDFDEAIDLNPRDAATYNSRGNALLKLGEFQQAILDYDEAIRLDPQYVWAYNNRGLSHSNLGQHQQAIRDYDEAIVLNPQYIRAYDNRGTAYLNLNQFQLAVQDYDEALRLDPQYARAYNNRGTVHRTLGEYELAIQDFNEAIRLNSGNSAAYVNRALASTHLDLLSEAQRDVERAVELGVSRTLLEQEIERIKQQR